MIKIIANNEIYRQRVLGEIPSSISIITEKDVSVSENDGSTSSSSSSSSPEEASTLDSIKQPLNNNNKSSTSSPLNLIQKREFHSSSSQFNYSDDRENFLKIDSQSSLIKKTNILGTYFEEVDRIINSTLDNPSNEFKEQAQAQLEDCWLDLIEDKLKDPSFFLSRHQDRVLSSIKSCQKTLDLMEKNKYLVRKFPQLGDLLNSLELILLTFSLCLSLYTRLSYNSLAIKVGEEILYWVWKKNKKGRFTEEISRSYRDYKEAINMDTINILKLGDFFLSLLQTYPHEVFIREIKLDSYYTNEPYFLKINSEYLEDIKKNLIINPMSLPMICQPKEWSEIKYGGFLTNEDRYIDVITGIDRFKHNIENKTSIYQAVNYLNSIKFKINTQLLNYITSDEGNYILEQIKADDELQRTITLELSKLYSKTPFYLNTHSDWRGRIYTQSFFLSYQAGDLSLSLLNFWKGEKINDEGKFYLYIYGANSHDQNKISKASYKDRIEWVTKNYDKIINLDKELILSADSPFIFTAFCLNMRELHNSPDALIYTPVFLDATCSGIQHFAALMKDLELGTNTNLIESTIEDKPGDIYETLLKPINEAINKFGEENKEYSLLSLVKLWALAREKRSEISHNDQSL
jgi:hypothetical protein